eukprot:g7275.t1
MLLCLLPAIATLALGAPPTVGAATPNVSAALDAFALDFWAWRSATAPTTMDDLPRTALVRPSGWAPNCSSAALVDTTVAYDGFAARLDALRLGGGQPFERWARDDQVDYWALTSALARVYWELQLLRPHTRDPVWYVTQGPGAVWDSLVRRPNNADAARRAADGDWSAWWPEARLRLELLPRLRAVAPVLRDAAANLERGGEAVPCFYCIARDALGLPAAGAGPDPDSAARAALGKQLESAVLAVTDVAGAASPAPAAALLAELRDAAGVARSAVEDYGSFVAARAPAAQCVLNGSAGGGLCGGGPNYNASVGEGAYHWFLRHVSFTNMSTDTIIDIGRRQLSRATAGLVAEQHRNNAAGLPPLADAVPLAPSLAVQRNATVAAWATVRRFLEQNRLLTVPPAAELPPYGLLSIPPWLTPFEYGALGEEDDFGASLGPTGMARFLPAPTAGMPFFLDSLARDARPVIVHEAMPGHNMQFRVSWGARREARRHWLDSLPNEGLAFHFEELTLQGGLFDEPSARLRETMWSFMRLRALRVEADAALATGRMGPAAAVVMLQRQVPLSAAEATSEVRMRLETPAQGLSYVLGKAQLFDFMEQATEAAGAAALTGGFDLRAFHDALERNGNLPFALQRHAAGVDSGLDPAFANIHRVARPAGVPLRQALLAPDRVTALPGAPAGDASVNPAQFAGYVNVAPTRELFYYLVAAQAPVGADDRAAGASAASAPAPAPAPVPPLIVWLQGGNGCSSMSGAFSENGPYVPGADGASLASNEHSWHKLPAHTLYVDRPAGAGFSYSSAPVNETAAYATDAQTARDTLAFLRGVLRKHPWLCGRKLWVAGESYAGHFTIQFATLAAAAEADSEDPLCVSVGGVMAGNAVVDINQTNYAWFEAGYSHSLVSQATWDGLNRHCNFSIDMGVDGNGCPPPGAPHQTAACAALIQRWFNESGSSDERPLLSLYDFYTDRCDAAGAAGAATLANACLEQRVDQFLNRASVRHALHVSAANAPARWEGCSQTLNDAYSCADTLDSMVPLYAAMVNGGRRVLAYSGDVDGVVPTLATRRWVRALQLETADGAAAAGGWRAWVDDSGNLGGYVEQHAAAGGGEATFATVRNAGHMVPRFQPARAFAMVRRFMAGEEL